MLFISFLNNLLAEDGSQPPNITSHPISIDNYTKARQKSKNTFKCAGIGLIDYGMAVDREGYFFNISSQEPICIYGMVSSVCADSTSESNCTCPPVGWKENKCTEKYSEFKRIEYIKWKKNYDEMLKKKK